MRRNTHRCQRQLDDLATGIDASDDVFDKRRASSCSVAGPQFVTIDPIVSAKENDSVHIDEVSQETAIHTWPYVANQRGASSGSVTGPQFIAADAVVGFEVKRSLHIR